jgi:hypothetical protein
VQQRGSFVEIFDGDWQRGVPITVARGGIERQYVDVLSSNHASTSPKSHSRVSCAAHGRPQ